MAVCLYTSSIRVEHTEFPAQKLSFKVSKLNSNPNQNY